MDENKFPDRHTYLGGSDAAAAVGLSPWKTRLELWLEKTQQQTSPLDPLSDPLFWGTHLEGPIAKAAEKHGLKLRRDNRELVHPTYPWIRGHIDRKIEGKPQMAEIKTAGMRSALEWGESGTNEVPLHYLCQVYHYLGLTAYEGCHVIVLIGGQDLRTYYIERDQEAIDMLYEQECVFWELVQTGSPPDPTNAVDLDLLFPQSVKEIVYADKAMERNLYELQQAVAEEKRATELVESYKNVIKHQMGNADTVLVDEFPACTWKTQKRKTFDAARFAEDHPDLYQEYQKTTEHRVFRRKEMK